MKKWKEISARWGKFSDAEVKEYSSQLEQEISEIEADKGSDEEKGI